VSLRALPVEPVESLAANCLDGEPSAPSKSTHTVNGYLCSARMMESWTRFQSGETSEPSEAVLGLAASMSLAVDSPVKISASPEAAPESTANGLDCGPRWPESFARLSPNGRSWKTRQHSLLGGLAEFSETWPTWGWMRDGECSELPTPVPELGDLESSLLPTPTARDWNGHTVTKKRPSGFNRVLPNVFKIELKLYGQCFPHPSFSEEVMEWPIGWSGLEPLGMDKFREWFRSHGDCLEGRSVSNKPTQGGDGVGV
jgi:hypothetical protein